jgi:hypothetical protein
MKQSIRSTLLAIAVAASPLAAQQKSPAPAAPAAVTPKATISGVVIDSLNGRYLAGADVIVQGARTALTTDSSGRFHIDSLTPGTYQVGVFHPLLDTLGISLATQPFHVGADSASYIVLAIPSASTIIRAQCKVRPRAQGSSAVIGRVEDPETMQPVAGAEVSIAWMEIEASKQTGVRQTPRLIRDSTDATGSYHLCGLPAGMDGTLQARRGKSVTAEVPVAIAEGETNLFTRTLLLAPVDSGITTGTASVSGKVMLEGTPVGAGTRVEIAGTEAVTTTNESGEFTLKNLPSGTHNLVARHIGFGAEVVPVDLTSRSPRTVSIRLPKFVAVMDPVLVTARRTAALDKVGFSSRQKMGNGYFLGPEQIQRMNPMYVTDALRQVPGLRVVSGPQGDVVQSSRGVSSLSGGDCTQFVVDGMPWMSMEPGDVNNFVSGHEMAAVEVYQAANTPPEYAHGRSCTTIVIWTKSRIRS